MPYIKESNREQLDNCIQNMSECIKDMTGSTNTGHILPDSGDINDLRDISNEEFLLILGDINYCFSRVLSRVMGSVSYSKIAMVTGVLENIKQEFYRRIAEPYENLKIIENGDIKEYKKFPL